MPAKCNANVKDMEWAAWDAVVKDIDRAVLDGHCNEMPIVRTWDELFERL